MFRYVAQLTTMWLVQCTSLLSGIKVPTFLSPRLFPSKSLSIFSLTVLYLLTLPSLAADTLEVPIVFVQRQQQLQEPLSLLDVRIEDESLKGVELGLSDNQTTGKFLKHKYSLDVVSLEEDEALAADAITAKTTSSEPPTLLLADLQSADLLALADAFPDSLVMNVRAQDHALRMTDCRANVFHIVPSRTMLTDGLTQFLNFKRWNRVVLVTGRHPQDEYYADAMRRSIKRFGLKLVDEKRWTSVPGARRTDSGHHSLQKEVPAFSRFKKHDVVLVADEADEFGEYLTYSTSESRLVMGTQGLIATAWHRSHEQWGGTQLQRRFTELAGRHMTPRDHAGWVGMRALGEAVTNTSSNVAKDLREFMLSDKFKLAAFKGAPLTFRRWNGQLRQPVLITGPRMLVSVSPQEGFLHERTELDTLGVDRNESTCKVFEQ